MSCGPQMRRRPTVWWLSPAGFLSVQLPDRRRVRALDLGVAGAGPETAGALQRPTRRSPATRSRGPRAAGGSRWTSPGADGSCRDAGVRRAVYDAAHRVLGGAAAGVARRCGRRAGGDRQLARAATPSPIGAPPLHVQTLPARRTRRRTHVMRAFCAQLSSWLSSVRARDSTASPVRPAATHR